VFARFTRAILRVPGANFADGITAADEGPPQLERALEQHASYSDALRGLGLTLEILPADEGFPDGTFVEDTAIVMPKGAIITRPGADSRRGETGAIATILRTHYSDLAEITAPGTVDGGDICETDDCVLIGLSARTNPEGGDQLARLLGDLGYRSRVIDVRHCPQLLHFKTGVSALGEGRLAVAPGLPPLEGLADFEQIVLDPAEAYAANCVRVNGHILVPTGAPRFTDHLGTLGLSPLVLDMSEFRKMDGGLSCLSLRV